MAVRLPAPLRRIEAAAVAERAGLALVDDGEPGFTRRRHGRGFCYLDGDGHVVDNAIRDRLRALAVPPAWTDVWFARPADAHLLATGFDDATRKQYRYHEHFQTVSNQMKFERLVYFGRAVVELRKAVSDDLASAEAGSRRLAIAAAVALIDEANVRVGNRRSARRGHLGATTLGPDNIGRDGNRDGRTDTLTIEFIGKSGAERAVEVADPDLVSVMVELADHGDDHLFSYDGESGDVHGVRARDLNDYIGRHAGRGFSTKDFRTWGGTVAAVAALAGGAGELEAIDAAADALGNTRAVARSSYVHPAVTASAEAVRSAYRSSRNGVWLDRAESATVKVLTESV